MLVILLVLVSCGKDERLKVIHNNDRVSSLETRVSVLEQTSATKTEVQILMNSLGNLQNEVNDLTIEFGALLFEMRDKLDLLEFELSAIQTALMSTNANVEALREELDNIQINVTNIINQTLVIDGCIISLSIERQGNSSNSVISDVKLQLNCN